MRRIQTNKMSHASQQEDMYWEYVLGYYIDPLYVDSLDIPKQYDTVVELMCYWLWRYGDEMEKDEKKWLLNEAFFNSWEEFIKGFDDKLDENLLKKMKGKIEKDVFKQFDSLYKIFDERVEKGEVARPKMISPYWEDYVE